MPLRAFVAILAVSRHESKCGLYPERLPSVRFSRLPAEPGHFAFLEFLMSLSSMVRAATVGCLLLVASFARAEEQGFELAPNNPDVLGLIEVGQIIDSPAFKQFASEFPDLSKNLDQPLDKTTKLTPRNFQSIFFAANTTQQDFVIVFNLTEETEIDEVLSADQQAKGTKIGDYTLFALDNGQALCLVDENTIAVGPHKSLSAVLKRDDEAEVSETLTAAWENIDGEQQIYVVATLDKLTKQAAGSIPAGIPLTPATLAKLNTATFTATTDKKNLTLSLNLNCTDADTANQLKSLLELGLQAAQQDESNPAEVKRALKALKSSTDEEILAVDFQVGLNTILEQFKSQINGVLGAQ
jgi:hypothetical protein